MSPSMIALLGALAAVAGGLIAVFASQSVSRKRNGDGGGMGDSGSQHDRSGAFDGGGDGGGGGD